MPDAGLRRLERAAAAGDPEAVQQFWRERLRAGVARDPRRDLADGDVIHGTWDYPRMTPDHRRVVSGPFKCGVVSSCRQRPDYSLRGLVHGEHANLNVHWERVEGSGRGQKRGCISLQGWRRWARGGKVLAIGPDPVPSLERLGVALLTNKGKEVARAAGLQVGRWRAVDTGALRRSIV